MAAIGDSTADRLQPGDPRRLGEYELIGRLGTGGQGAVFLGRDAGGREVAIKLLHGDLADDTTARERFVREASAAKRVARFCAAQVLDADVEGDRPYIVSEYVRGPSLQRLVREHGPVAGGALDRLAIGTATALVAIHQAGIVHRDLKPANVLLAPDGPRVIDFGIAKALDGSATLSSRVVGTPAYMSPEQLSGARVTPAVDVFAWGATMTYVATGRPPFGMDSIPLVANRIMNLEPDLGDLSGTVRELVAACLAKDPALRPTAPQLLLRLIGRPGAAPAAPVESTAVLDAQVLARAATLAAPRPGAVGLGLGAAGLAAAGFVAAGGIDGPDAGQAAAHHAPGQGEPPADVPYPADPGPAQYAADPGPGQYPADPALGQFQEGSGPGQYQGDPGPGQFPADGPTVYGDVPAHHPAGPDATGPLAADMTVQGHAGGGAVRRAAVACAGGLTVAAMIIGLVLLVMQPDDKEGRRTGGGATEQATTRPTDTGTGPNADPAGGPTAGRHTPTTEPSHGGAGGQTSPPTGTGGGHPGGGGHVTTSPTHHPPTSHEPWPSDPPSSHEPDPHASVGSGSLPDCGYAGCDD